VNESRTTPDAAADAHAANGNTADADAAVPISQQELVQLRQKAGERDSFLDLLQRTRADFENYQKQHSRRLEQERPYIHLNVLREVLPVLDNLERAVAAAQQVGEKGPLVEGVNMVLVQLQNLLRNHNVRRIEAEGQPFDPNLHQAVAQVPAPDKPANTVVGVLEQGYVLQDRVLRPARVTVSTTTV
jgi:molecular chaperone GrpE